MDDESVQMGMASLLLLAGAVLAVGGWRTPVAGVWHDGARQVHLRQLLFYLRGHAEVAGGKQIFRGFVLYGRLMLWRSDFGARHLQHLGFEPQQTRKLQGQVTGLFRLLWHPATPTLLSGSFSGKRFVFDGNALQAATYVAPEPRAWARSGS